MPQSRDDLIKDYFSHGLAYDEILSLMDTRHGVKLTLRHLHRILRLLSLYRRRNKSSINEVLNAVAEEIQGPAASVGYRQMHQIVRKKGLVTDKETVRCAIKAIDPEGVAERGRRRLKRRVYSNNGPNFLWHMDGYDKLKPFGFAIHGGIDGYSRRIMWLNVGSSNNDPAIIATYFVNCIEQLEIFPRAVRADRGSENVIAGGIQRFLHRHADNVAAHDSFKYGPSTQNQRIEAWWSQLRRSRSNWWMNFFKDFCDTGDVDLSIPHHLDCIRYCFLGLIQQELDEVKSLWNHHRIRKVKNSNSPPGRPEVLYFAPHLSDGRDYGSTVVRNDLDLAKHHCKESLLLGCSAEFLEFAREVIDRNDGINSLPKTAVEGTLLFNLLINELGNHLVTT